MTMTTTTAGGSGNSYGAIGVSSAAVDDKGGDDLLGIVAGEDAPLLPGFTAAAPPPPPRSLWTRLTFGWVSPLFQTGNAKGQLDVEDLDSQPLPPDCETAAVYEVFLEYWKEELELERASREESLKKSRQGKGDNGGKKGKQQKQEQNGDNGGKEKKEENQEDIDDNDNDDDNDCNLDLLGDLDAAGLDASSIYQPSLVRALRRAFGRDFLVAGGIKLVHDSNLFVGPQVLNALIHFLRDPDATSAYGLGLVLIVTVSNVVMSVCLRHYFYKCYTCGLRIRTALVVAIYRKSLVLSLKERHSHGGPGEIANLVGIDAQRMQDLMTYLHAVWYSFFQIIMAMYFLWGQVGPSCLAGAVAMALMVPVTKFVSSALGRIQRTVMKARDERVSLNNEVLGAMKVIKIQAWEEDFRSRLLALRDSELGRLRKYFLTGALSMTMFQSTPLLVALATFTAYTLAGNGLDVAQALTTLALLAILRFPLMMLPNIINRIVESGISLERLREFLLCEEYGAVGEGSLKETGEVYMRNGTFVYDSKKPKLEDDDEEGGGKGGKKKKKGGIAGLMQQHRRMMREAALDRQWEMCLLRAQLRDAEDQIDSLERELHPDVALLPSSAGDGAAGKCHTSSLLSLRRVTMQCKPGEFVAVVGGVGAGKSTLINSIIGEGRPLTGSELAVKGKLGLFLQTPFIMNDTVRNNILFGHASGKKAAMQSAPKAVDEGRYRLALKVCSLSHDLELLQHGDATEIGEKGITLSGGQKARVALARAFYHDADVYLLDDPLAAVDAHVGKDLFNKCIVDELLLGKSKDLQQEKRNATVILVTNALQHLSHPMVDKIIVLGDGCVEEVGTFKELSSDTKSRFSAFLQTIADTSKSSIEHTPPDANDADVVDEDDLSEDDDEDEVPVVALDGGDEPEVTKVVHHDQEGRKSRGSIRRLSMGSRGSVTRNSVRRRSSAKSATDGSKGGALTTDEFKERSKGSIGWDVYIAWVRKGGGLPLGAAILLMFAAVEFLNVLSKWWLTYWSESGGSNAFFFLGIYALVNVSAMLVSYCRLVIFIFAGLRASRSMFKDMLDVILQAPMSFFDTTPVGRIINRFSKDMFTVDEQLVGNLRMCLVTMINLVSSILVIIAVTPKFLLGLAPIIIYYLHSLSYFTKSFRELKRLDSVSRSPIYALLAETIDGVVTIRAFDAQESLSSRMIGMLETQQMAYHLTFASQCWLGLRLEFAGSMIVACACLMAVMQHSTSGADEHFAGLGGLSISFALAITSTLNFAALQASNLEANMVAVERILQYSKITGEAPRLASSDDSLPPNWPVEGRIEFVDVKMRYRSNLPLTLKGLNISIPPMSKVGVVGRTGAGKSTLMVALLRIVELHSGCIKIDGVDIRSVGLKKLRSKIAVIPQDPVLFSGTVRTNLDPFDEYDDSRLFEVLAHVGMYAPVQKVSSKLSLSSQGSDRNAGGGGRTQPIKSLSDEVSEGGTNFSVGQRQLLVIARAMLTGASLVIMDEATASVDADTDARIQRVFRSEFKDATCITVAHRLNTIMDSDLVLVMDDGRAAEFDKPSSLLSKADGIFKSLVDAWEEEN